jgi:hypothetical protein
MSVPRVSGHNEVPSNAPHDIRSSSSGVCGCGAVYDYGNVAVPAEFYGLCGRCAVQRGLRLSTTNWSGQTPRPS